MDERVETTIEDLKLQPGCTQELFSENIHDVNWKLDEAASRIMDAYKFRTIEKNSYGGDFRKLGIRAGHFLYFPKVDDPTLKGIVFTYQPKKPKGESKDKDLNTGFITLPKEFVTNEVAMTTHPSEPSCCQKSPTVVLVKNNKEAIGQMAHKLPQNLKLNFNHLKLEYSAQEVLNRYGHLIQDKHEGKIFGLEVYPMCAIYDLQNLHILYGDLEHNAPVGWLRHINLEDAWNRPRILMMYSLYNSEKSRGWEPALKYKEERTYLAIDYLGRVPEVGDRVKLDFIQPMVDIALRTILLDKPALGL